MREYTDIIVEEQDGVALLKLNRPEKLNSMGGTMMGEATSYLNSLNSGEYRVRAVVMTGEGRAFCAGGDVTASPAPTPTASARHGEGPTRKARRSWPCATAMFP